MIVRIMTNLQQISDSQARDCIKNGEFGGEIIATKPKVAVVLTQSWCPSWVAMTNWIGEIKNPDIAIWSFIYDASEIFKEFLEFKEETLGNREIPYIRYYQAGKFITDTNYIDKDRFLKMFKD